MKKYVICMLAIVIAIASSSFNVIKKTSAKKHVFTYRWYNFQGGLFDLCDPNYYTPDDDNIPDCPSALGIIYCDVRALPSQQNPDQPDLTTISACRYRPLL